MVVSTSPGIATPTPAADVTVLSRIGIVGDLPVFSHSGLEPVHDKPVIGSVVARSVDLWLEFGPGSHHIHELRQLALNGAHEIRIL